MLGISAHSCEQSGVMDAGACASTLAVAASAKRSITRAAWDW